MPDDLQFMVVVCDAVRAIIDKCYTGFPSSRIRKSCCGHDMICDGGAGIATAINSRKRQATFDISWGRAL